MLEIAAIERDLNLGDIPIEKEVFGIEVDLTVHKKFEGDIYFYYQSKSIAQLIQLLFQQNNLLVAFCILIFSVIVFNSTNSEAFSLMIKSRQSNRTLVRNF